jgi:hypothetical protein
MVNFYNNFALWILNFSLSTNLIELKMLSFNCHNDNAIEEETTYKSRHCFRFFHSA